MVKVLLILVILLSLGTGFYKISEVPSSLSWDEAAVGYDAYAISKDGKDQWGQLYPVAFKSFEEYKYPLHIYITAFFVSIFGLSEATVRAQSVIFGAVNVLLLFFLVTKITNNKYLGLISCIFLSISPWFIHFSRVNWEINIALMFFQLGLLLFFYGIKNRHYLLIPSLVFFGIDLYVYNATKIFIPVFLLILITIYRKELIRIRLFAFLSLVIFLVIFSIAIINSKLSGLTRFEQVSFDDNIVRKTLGYRITKIHYVGRFEIIFKQYLSHFTPKFLYISGDSNPRHSSQLNGQLYWIDLLLLPVGLYYLIKSRGKTHYVVLSWFFLAPLPAAFTREAPHASRAMFALGGWQIVSAFGAYYLINKIRKKSIRKIVFIGLILVVTCLYLRYIYNYFVVYSSKYASAWQYGYKSFLNKYNVRFSEFDNILISDRYDQPYIFTLFYLKYEPQKFRSQVQYNNTIRRKTSLVKSFDKFIFRDIDYYQIPNGKNLIFTHITDKMDEIKWKEIIYNPDGSIGGYVYEYEK